MNRFINLVRRPFVFWALMAATLLLMVLGHVIIHGQNYNLLGGATYSPLTSYVSDYAAKWPEGLWIKSAIVCFCLALAWFCDLATRELATGYWLIAGRLYWLIVTGLMIAGLFLVCLFDMLPERYMDGHTGWFSKVLGMRPSHDPVPRSPQEWSMRWYHNLGFYLFIGAYAAAAFVLVIVEIKRRAWAEVATSLFLLAAASVFVWWLSRGTLVPGVPQRAVLILIAFWLVRSVQMLRMSA
jgi:hypothetical protein